MRHPRLLPAPATAVLCLSVAVAATLSARPQSTQVRIRVVDVDSGVPIAHVRIASLSAPPLSSTLTDSHGDVALDVPRSGRSIRVSKAGYASQTLKLEADAAASAQQDAAMEVKLARGATISGRAVDGNGAAVVNRRVQVERVDGTARYQSTTDDLGEYRVGGLPAGTYTVSLPVPPPAASDAAEHTVIVRRGDDGGGIDFTVSSRGTCTVVEPQSIRVTPPGNSGIRGRVVNSSGSPIPCVTVVAFRGADRAASVLTDADGRYQLRALRPGSYPLEFKRNGYVTRQWGQQQGGQPGRPVVVRNGEELRNINMTLPRGGAIVGTLLDEFLEPAENVKVRALELRGDSGRQMAVETATALTDDRGRYRLYGLIPGRYIVATAAATEPPDPRTGKGYAPAYYPGVVEIASARPVDVAEEKEKQYVDFPREPVRVATVTGTALNSRNEPVTDHVILVASQRSGAVVAETQGAEVKGPDGAFTITNVPPGDYVVQATSKRGEMTPEFGMQYVSVYQDDPPALRIKTGAGVNLQGRLIQDGAPPIDPRSFGVTAVPVDWDQTSVLTGMQTITPDDTGTLRLDGVTGPRRFVLTSAPSNWYLKSVRVRGRDVTDDVTGFAVLGFEFVRDLEVVVSNKGATVKGDVMDGSTPAGDFSVVLFPSNPDHWFHRSRFLKTTRGTGAGHFQIEGVADGDYYIAAVDPLDGSADDAWQDRDFLNLLTTNARRVRLREGEERSLTLAITHR